MSRLKKVEFEFEVITPMFTRGADGNTPEFRVAPFKAEMRYWLRALLGGLMNQNHSEVLKIEQLFFGGSGDNAFQSPIQLHISNTNLVPGQYLILPHKAEDRRNSKRTAIGINSTFTLVLKCLLNDVKINNNRNLKAEKIELMFEISTALFELISYVGTVGLRGKRGFGSFQIKQYELEFNNVEKAIVEKISELKSKCEKLLQSLTIQTTPLYNPISDWPVLGQNSFDILLSNEANYNDTLKSV